MGFPRIELGASVATARGVQSADKEHDKRRAPRKIALAAAQDEPRNGSRHAEFLAGAEGISEILEGVQAYLGSWSKERIVSLQKMDGGWAPFDASQRPLRIGCLAKVHAVGDAIHRHCIALRTAGFPLTPELVELDEFLYRARELIRMRTSEARRRDRPSLQAGLHQL